MGWRCRKQPTADLGVLEKVCIGLPPKRHGQKPPSHRNIAAHVRFAQRVAINFRRCSMASIACVIRETQRSRLHQRWSSHRLFARSVVAISRRAASSRKLLCGASQWRRTAELFLPAAPCTLWPPTTANARAWPPSRHAAILFFVDLVKFQHPATSLLLYSGLDLIGIQLSECQCGRVSRGCLFVMFQTCVIYIEITRMRSALPPQTST